MKMRSVYAQIAQTSGATLATVISSAIMLAITARALGPDGRGVYSAASAWVGTFAVIGALSLGQVIVHHTAGRPKADWLAPATGTLLALYGAITAIGWIIATIAYVATGGKLFQIPATLLAIAFVALPFAVSLDGSRYVLISIGQLRISNRAQIAGAVVGVVAAWFLVVMLRLGIAGALVAFVSTSVVASVVSYSYLRREAGELPVDRELGRLLLKGSSRLHWNAVGNYLFTQASVLILNFYHAPRDTAFYQLAMQLFGLALIVSSAAGTVAYGLVAEKGPDGAWPEQRLLMMRSLLVVTALAAAGYFLTPLVVRLIAGEQFLPAVPLFRMLLPALPGATFSMLMASQWVGRGLFRQVAMLTLGVGCISLATDFYFIPRYGMRGALVSTLVTYGVSVIGNGAMAIWVQRQWRRHVAAAS